MDIWGKGDLGSRSFLKCAAALTFPFPPPPLLLPQRRPYEPGMSSSRSRAEGFIVARILRRPGPVSGVAVDALYIAPAVRLRPFALPLPR